MNTLCRIMNIDYSITYITDYSIGKVYLDVQSKCSSSGTVIFLCVVHFEARIHTQSCLAGSTHHLCSGDFGLHLAGCTTLTLALCVAHDASQLLPRLARCGWDGLGEVPVSQPVACIPSLCSSPCWSLHFWPGTVCKSSTDCQGKLLKLHGATGDGGAGFLLKMQCAWIIARVIK